MGAFFQGPGRLDTALRAVALSAMLAVSGLLIWTTFSLRNGPPPSAEPSVFQGDR